jgi:hypothetical protein
MKAPIGISTIVAALLTVATVSCSKSPQSNVNKARESLSDVHEQLGHLAPADDDAADRFLHIYREVENADTHLTAAAEEIERLRNEVDYLKNPESAKFPKEEQHDTTVWQKVQFWKQVQPVPAPTPVPAPERSWAFWK